MSTLSSDRFLGIAINLIVPLLLPFFSNELRSQSYPVQTDFFLTGQTTGTVWGTDSYSVLSDLPTAAVHAGILAPGQSAKVRIIPAGSLSQFAGSTRNGVSSLGSFFYQGAIRLQLAPIGGAWPGLNGTDLAITGAYSSNNLYGTDYYKYDSDLSAAAVHLGLVAAGQTKTLRFLQGPIVSFVGSTRFGIPSWNWGIALESFTLTLPPGAPQSPNQPYIVLQAPSSVLQTEPIRVTAQLRDPDSDLTTAAIGLGSSPQTTHTFGAGLASEVIAGTFFEAGSGYRQVTVVCTDSRYPGSGDVGIARSEAYVNILQEQPPPSVLQVTTNVVALTPGRVDFVVVAASSQTAYRAVVRVDSPSTYGTYSTTLEGFPTNSGPVQLPDGRWSTSYTARLTWEPPSGLTKGARYYAYATVTAYNGMWSGSTSAPSEIIAFDALLDQTISFAAIADRPLTGGPITFNPSASSGLPVDLLLESGPATLSGKTVTPTDYGRIVLRAVQNGNEDYRPAADVVRSFLVASTPLPDSDRDGIPDWWEQLYSLNPYNSADALSDADGDGLTAAEEFHLGLSPNAYNTPGSGVNIQVQSLISGGNP